MHLREVFETKQALAGDVDIHFVTDLPLDEVSIVFMKLWRQVYQFEKSFSRFIPMSELSIFNRQAGLKSFITPEFKEVLDAAKMLGMQTKGLYNPFILPALQRAGYIQSAAKGYENDAQEDYSKKRVVAVERLEIGANWARIPYGTAIDLGGCGKGYLADMLGKTLDQIAPVGYWISLSGDIKTKGTDENKAPIYLHIQDATDPTAQSELVIKCSSAPTGVATSGTFRRSNQKSTNPWHHLIDPTTQLPAKTDVRLATVVASNTLTADVLASCAVLLGSKKAPLFLKENGAKAALLQCVDDNGTISEMKFGQSIKKLHASKPGKVHSHA